MEIILKAALSMAGLGLGLGIILGIAHKKFAVEVDPNVEKILDVLPGANCGACGYAGCEGAAEAIAKGEAPVEACVAGGHEIAEQVAHILGKDVQRKHKPTVSLVHCKGGKSKVSHRYRYDGIPSCNMAQQVASGPLMCSYGCLGFGDCVEACPFDALSLDGNSMPQVDVDKCTGCGLCAKTCPRDIISLVPKDVPVIVFCNSKDKPRIKRNICTVSCIGCKACEKVCEVDAVVVQNNLAVVNYEECNGCGKCVEKCPRGCLNFLKLKV
ncbi:MAG: RnfABCDGE type electron transport complex subunit B [Actinomycetota bacterium]|nr:RnfABCDGE type electron transport complex subunit B [Actinomycetota bacterium]